MADMDMYAEVLQSALNQGKRVAPGVHLYLQFGSQKIKQYARNRGYIEIFEKAGAELIDPSCGACINAGPGASPSAETVTVSAQNRNFPAAPAPANSTSLPLTSSPPQPSPARSSSQMSFSVFGRKNLRNRCDGNLPHHTYRQSTARSGGRRTRLRCGIGTPLPL